MGAKKPWHVVLNLPSSSTWKQVQARREQLLQQHRPDKGGSLDQAAEINAAYDDARIAFRET